MISVERMDEYCRPDGENEPSGVDNIDNVDNNNNNNNNSGGSGGRGVTDASNNSDDDISPNIEEGDGEADLRYRGSVTDNTAESLVPSRKKLVERTAAAAAGAAAGGAGGFPSPSPDWPARGKVEVSGLVMRYRRGLSPALNGVNLVVGAGEKVCRCA